MIDTERDAIFAALRRVAPAGFDVAGLDTLADELAEELRKAGMEHPRPSAGGRGPHETAAYMALDQAADRAGMLVSVLKEDPKTDEEEHAVASAAVAHGLGFVLSLGRAVTYAIAGAAEEFGRGQ